MSSDGESEAYIAFVEKVEPWQLMSHFFPCKIGGRPSWLALKKLPSQLVCDECQTPLTFLMQVYAPISGRETCFHRTMFVFFCKNNECYEKSKKPTFKAFRSQLGKSNSYFSPEPPDYDANVNQIRRNLKKGLPNVSQFTSVCATCGCPGNFKCSACNKENYCCREHQLIDWKIRHKQLCKKIRSGELDHEPALNFTANSVILPELGLSEPEIEGAMSDSDVDDEEEDGGEDAEEDKDEIRIQLMKESLQSSSLREKELESFAKGETPETKQFQRFQKRIAENPTQVLRYQRNGQPLWVSTLNQLDAPPPCDLCGGKRIFEFQIMPQLLNHLNLDVKDGSSPDWGSLYVYTCAASCDIEDSTYEYASEFVWKQDVTE